MQIERLTMTISKSQMWSSPFFCRLRGHPLVVVLLVVLIDNSFPMPASIRMDWSQKEESFVEDEQEDHHSNYCRWRNQPDQIACSHSTFIRTLCVGSSVNEAAQNGDVIQVYPDRIDHL